jgi:hypothetical protein
MKSISHIGEKTGAAARAARTSTRGAARRSTLVVDGAAAGRARVPVKCDWLRNQKCRLRVRGLKSFHACSPPAVAVVYSFISSAIERDDGAISQCRSIEKPLSIKT